MRTQVRPLSLSVQMKPGAGLCPSARGGKGAAPAPKGCAPLPAPCRRGWGVRAGDPCGAVPWCFGLPKPPLGAWLSSSPPACSSQRRQSTICLKQRLLSFWGGWDAGATAVSFYL